MSLALPNPGIDVEAMVGSDFTGSPRTVLTETACNAPVKAADRVLFCLIASPGRIMSFSMRWEGYMLHSNGPQVIVASQRSAVHVIFGRTDVVFIAVGNGECHKLSEQARCMTPPT